MLKVHHNSIDCTVKFLLLCVRETESERGYQMIIHVRKNERKTETKKKPKQSKTNRRHDNVFWMR